MFLREQLKSKVLNKRKNIKAFSRISYMLLLFGIVGVLSLLIFEGADFVIASLFHNNTLLTVAVLSSYFFIYVHKIAKVSWIDFVLLKSRGLYKYFAFSFLLFSLLLLFSDSFFPWQIIRMKSTFSAFYFDKYFYIVRGLVILSGFFFGLKLFFQLRRDSTKIFSLISLLSFLSIIVISWDWGMSLINEWHSTLLPWIYMIAGINLFLGVVIIFSVFFFNEEKSTLLILARYLLVSSIMLTYLLYSQYMLLWYGNLDEDALSLLRIFTEPNKYVYLLSFVFIFVLPFFLLLSNKAKKNKVILVISSCSAIIGNWLNFIVFNLEGMFVFNVIMEFLVFLGFLGIFSLVTLKKTVYEL
jgi:hypothetical protein